MSAEVNDVHIEEGEDLREVPQEKRMFLFRVFMAELLVTFIFLFVVMASSINLSKLGTTGDSVQSAIVTGFCAVAVIYSFADVSGAHFNPAVTFATVVTRKTSIKKGLCYVLAQIIASVLATLWIGVLFDFDEIPKLNLKLPDQGVALLQAFLMETTLTSILCYVIFATAFENVDSENVELSRVIENQVETIQGRKLTLYNISGSNKSGFAPLAIGLTLGFLTMIGGGVSGGAFNPARAFGPAFCTGSVFSANVNLWLYWIGDFAGAAGAGFLQHFFHTVKKFESEKAITAGDVVNAFVPKELSRFTGQQES